MGGYQPDFSKSNNAVWAESEGRFPASVIAKKIGVPSPLISEHLAPCEWHHTSSWYNTTDYYDLEEAREFFLTEEGKEAIAEFRRESREVETFTDCRVEWLEWYGSRNHPKCEECVATKATVTVKRQTATIKLKDGTKFQKRLSTNGFRFYPNWTARVRANRQEKAELRKRFKAAAAGRKFVQCDYFTWRDRNHRDTSKTAFTAITHKEILDTLLSSDSADESIDRYALRTVERLEEGGREVIRLGLFVGLKYR